MAYSLNNKKCKGYILISFDEIPKNCSECQLYLESGEYNEEACFGDNIIHSCPFGGSAWGCLLNRPKDCPIITPENKSEKLRRE